MIYIRIIIMMILAKKIIAYNAVETERLKKHEGNNFKINRAYT